MLAEESVLCVRILGIRVSGSAALPQIIVSSRVPQLCGKFSSLLNPPHKQEQRDGIMTEMERFNTDPLLRPFSDLAQRWPDTVLLV